MVEIGYSLSSEEHPPNDLVKHAQMAEDAGFTFALISDHFHPGVTHRDTARWCGAYWAALLKLHSQFASAPASHARRYAITLQSLRKPQQRLRA